MVYTQFKIGKKASLEGPNEYKLEAYFALRRLKRYLKPTLPVAPRILNHGATAQCSIGLR
jgi:hypothetical protein